jgi:hypothetical protein
MLAMARLALAGVLAFSPLVECFDTWEQPWSGDSKGELVLTVLTCAIALGYACIRRISGWLRLIALRWFQLSSLSPHPILVWQRPLRLPLTFGLSPPPLRI